MQKPMSDDEYRTLDTFMKTVLVRLEAGTIDAGTAHADIMHPLTAWDKGNATEFAPWMKMRLQEWRD